CIELRMVNRVARYACKSALLMITSFPMDLHSVFMAGQANDGGFFRLHLAGIMDQGRIAAAVHVLAAGAVTRFATQGGSHLKAFLPVRRFCKRCDLLLIPRSALFPAPLPRAR